MVKAPHGRGMHIFLQCHYCLLFGKLHLKHAVHGFEVYYINPHAVCKTVHAQRVLYFWFYHNHKLSLPTLGYNCTKCLMVMM